MTGTTTTMTNTMTTGSMTMTDMEPENPGPLLRHPAHLHSALRQEIMREIADLPEADLRGVLRMIEQWKAGRWND